MPADIKSTRQSQANNESPLRFSSHSHSSLSLLPPQETQVMQYENKVAIITGGSKGIGKAVAAALVQRGAKVVIGDIADKEGMETVAALNEGKSAKVAIYTHCDVASWEQNKALFQLTEKEFGGVDFVILNAGISESSPTLVSDNELESFRTLEVNIGGVIKGTKLALLYMQKRGGGCIINVASMAGLYPNPMTPIYVASKHAVIGFTRSLELMKRICNVRVNAVCPFWVDTDIVSVPRKLDPIFDRMLKNEKFAPMNNVVDAFIQFIENPKFNGDAVMCLPDGNHLVAKPKMPPVTASRASPEERASIWSETTERYKRAIARAVKKAKL